MSCVSSIDFWSLVVKNVTKEESDKIKKEFQLTDFDEFFELLANKDRLFVHLIDYENADNIAEAVEELAQWLKETFNKRLEGHIIVESDGFRSRGELSEDGKFEYENLSWLQELPNNEIHRLKNLRRPYTWEPVELYCEHCGKPQPVTACMTWLDSFKAGLVYYPTDTENSGEVVIDWEGADASGDFRYECYECGERVAYSCDEICEICEKERN